MKRFFKFALVALATAAVAVACQKPEQQPEKIALKGISLNKPAVELAIGAKETLTVKFDPENVTEKPTIEWSSSAPAVATVAEGEVTAVAAGEATITAKAGSFTATCKVTVKGEEQPEPGDFTSPDWANIGAITNGNHTFKFTKDDKFAYFYTERPKDDRFGELWGDGVGYVYYAFDFDGDLTTGEELLGNGKYEYIAYIYCFGGSADAPEIKITAEGGVAPSSYSIANVIAKGTVDANGLKLEYAVPLSDLPQLPENFTIYTWGNKSLSKVEYKYPYEAPAVPKVASWAEAEAAGAIHFFQYLSDASWTPYPGYESVEAASFDNLTVANGVYTVTLDKVCPETWNAQLFMRPNPEIATLPLKADKRYLVSVTLESSVEYSPFAKFVQYDPALTASGEPKHEGATIYEWGSVRVKANTPKTLAYVFEGVECDNVNFTFGLGGYTESATVIIKDIKVEVTDRELGLIEDDPGTVAQPWDYTPSEEYKAASNLWKSIDDAGALSFFYHYPAAGYPAANADTYELLSKNQSTYVLNCPVAAAEGLWSNQLFMYPKEGHFIALDPAKTYKFKVTLGSNKDFPGFFKMTTYNPNNENNHVEGAVLWETNYEDGFFFDGGKPVVVETELTGKEANNIVLIFAFGKNPKECEVYIKDIIVEEVGGGVPPSVLNVDVLDMEFTAVDKTSNSYFDWSDRAGAASTAIYAGQSSTGTGQYIQLRTKNNNSGIITTASGGKLRQVTVAFNSATTDRKINVYAKNTAYTSPTDLYDDTKAGTLLGSIQAGSGNYTIDVTDDYAFVGLRSADGAIYVDKIEIAWEPSGDVPPAPTGIKIDGDFSDWDGIEAFASEATSRIREWKISSDDDNVYVYVAMRKNRAESSKKLVIGFNTDNDAATGSLTDNNNMKGCEAIARNIIPFISSTEGITGADSGSEVVSTAGATETGVVVVNAVPGTEDASSDSANCYLELSIPKAKLALPATAISVGCSYDYYFTGYKSVTL